MLKDQMTYDRPLAIKHFSDYPNKITDLIIDTIVYHIQYLYIEWSQELSTCFQSVTAFGIALSDSYEWGLKRDVKWLYSGDQHKIMDIRVVNKIHMLRTLS